VTNPTVSIRRRLSTTIIEVEEVPVAPLTYPEKVTAKWVWEHVPLTTSCALVTVVFGAGMAFQKLIS